MTTTTPPRAISGPTPPPRRHAAPVRGNTMLELVLLLPTYMLILYVVITMGEYGQVAAQLHHAATHTAWQKSDAETYPVAYGAREETGGLFVHFGPRTSAMEGTRVTKPVRLDGSHSSGETMGNCGSLILEGCHAYEIRELPDPLYGSGGAVDYYMSIYADGMPSLDTVVERSLDGDITAMQERSVPWMRRHYASVKVKYSPVGSFISGGEFRTMHMVLRAVSWRNGVHEPYNLSHHENLLRSVDAQPARNKIAAPGDDLHQMDVLDFQAYMAPSPPAGE